MDIVFIKGLTAACVIGIYDFEREILQDVVLDIEMEANIKAASATDDIEQAIDYRAVSDRIIAFIKKSEFQLIETLAERICAIILNEFAVASVKLTLDKGKILDDVQSVGVIINRKKARFID